jgi:hypothetical protein
MFMGPGSRRIAAELIADLIDGFRSERQISKGIIPDHTDEFPFVG